MTSLSALIAQVEDRKREIADIRDALFCGAYDGTEGKRGSPDMTWTDFGIAVGQAEAAPVLAAALKDALETMLENVGDSYNLLTQGESPTQRRNPSAQRIYDRSRSFLDRHKEAQ